MRACMISQRRGHTARCCAPAVSVSGSLRFKPPLGPACGLTGGRSGLLGGDPADRRTKGNLFGGLDRMSRRGRQGRAQRRAEAGEVANQNSKPSIMLGIHSKCVFPARAARYRSHFDAVASDLAGTGETDGN
jgi:hypothetical protein